MHRVRSSEGLKMERGNIQGGENCNKCGGLQVSAEEKIVEMLNWFEVIGMLRGGMI